MTLPTTSDFNNAKRDLDDLAEIVTSKDVKDVVHRTGESTPTIAKVFDESIKALSEAEKLIVEKDQILAAHNAEIDVVLNRLSDHAPVRNRGAWVEDMTYEVNDIWQAASDVWYVVVEEYVSGATDVDDIATGNVFVHQVNIATDTVASVAELRLFEPSQSGQNVNFNGYSIAGIGGGSAFSILNDPEDDNGVTKFKTQSGHSWNRPETELTTEMAGSLGVDDEDLTDAINSLKVLTNKILISNKSITLASDVQLDGVSVYGSDTIVKGFELVGGKLVNITSESQRERIMPVSNPSPIASRFKTKLVVREPSIPSGTPLDAYSVISPSSHGGIARFILATGVGGSGSGDLGGTWDRLRVVGSFLYSDGFVINNSITAQSGDVLPATHQLENFLDVVTDKYTPDGSNTITDIQLDQNEWVEFSVNGNVNQRGNVAFYTSSGSSDDITILVNGVEVGDRNSKRVSGAEANVIRLIDINYDKAEDNVVRITNNHASAKAYVYGVNLSKISNMDSMDSVDVGYIKNVILTGARPVLYSGNGASLDHVIRDDNSKLGGSYHGGETALGTAVSIRIQAASDYKKLEAQTSVNVDPSTIEIGDVLCGTHVLALSITSIGVNTGTLNVRTALDFGVDGGCNVTGSMNATSEIVLTRLYSGMHATDRSINRYLTGSLIEESATENYISIKRSMIPFYQFSSNNTQCCITPQVFDFGMSKKQSRIWDNENYIKFYYQPLDNVDYTLEVGEDLRFSCLYQYGENLI